MCLSLKQYLSAADNARDAVLLHVSASSERQEYRNGTSDMIKKEEQNTLKHSDACVSTFL
jgi:hypothetical protein